MDINTDIHKDRFSIDFHFNGRQGALALGLLVLLAASWFCMNYTITEQKLTREAIVGAIDPWVKAGYTRQLLPEMQAAVKKADTQTFVARGRTLTKIEYRSVTVKGVFSPLVVRIEIATDGHTPPDGNTFRYFNVGYDMLFNCWSCPTGREETTEAAFRGAWRVRRQWSSPGAGTATR